MIAKLTRPALPLLLISLISTSLAAAANPYKHVPINAFASGSLPQSPAGAATSGSASSADYLIGDDDLLEINVWNEPDLKQSLPVRSDGKITLPLIGEIQAAGKTPSQLQQAIAIRLKAYINSPSVTVIVLEMNSRKFNILGRVAKPGSYPLTATTTVLDAIAEAGGFLDFAKQKDIYILRKNSSGQETRLPFNYKAVIQGKHGEENVVLLPHDTVIVP